MPPIGLQKFAPILSHLSEEIMKLNEVIPKTLDVMTEVINTVDMVRQMKVDMTEVKQKFSCAVSGMQEAIRVVSRRESSAMEELFIMTRHGFRQYTTF